MTNENKLFDIAMERFLEDKREALTRTITEQVMNDVRKKTLEKLPQGHILGVLTATATEENEGLEVLIRSLQNPDDYDTLTVLQDSLDNFMAALAHGSKDNLVFRGTAGYGIYAFTATVTPDTITIDVFETVSSSVAKLEDRQPELVERARSEYRELFGSEDRTVH